MGDLDSAQPFDFSYSLDYLFEAEPIVTALVSNESPIDRLGGLEFEYPLSVFVKTERTPQWLVLVSSGADRIGKRHFVFAVVEVEGLVVRVGKDVAVHRTRQGLPNLRGPGWVDVISDFGPSLVVDRLHCQSRGREHSRSGHVTLGRSQFL